MCRPTVTAHGVCLLLPFQFLSAPASLSGRNRSLSGYGRRAPAMLLARFVRLAACGDKAQKEGRRG